MHRGGLCCAARFSKTALQRLRPPVSLCGRLSPQALQGSLGRELPRRSWAVPVSPWGPRGWGAAAGARPHLQLGENKLASWVPRLSQRPEGRWDARPFPNVMLFLDDDVIHTVKMLCDHSQSMTNVAQICRVPLKLFGTKKTLNNFILLDTWEIWT